MDGPLLCTALGLVWSAAATPAGDLQRGHTAFLAGDYHQAAATLEGLAARLPRNSDYALYLLAESAFYDGAPARARAAFEALGKQHASRLAPVAPWRIAD